MNAPHSLASLLTALQLFSESRFRFLLRTRNSVAAGSPAVALAKPIGISLIAIILGLAPAAHADTTDGAVNFGLPSDPPAASDAAANPAPAEPTLQDDSAAADAPAAESEALPPPVSNSSPVAESAPEAPPSPPSLPVSPADSPAPAPAASPVLSFAVPQPFIPAPPPPSNPPPAPKAPQAAATSPAPSTPAALSDLFTGGSDSLVARTVGHAEGTRTPNGGKTRAYQGHVDPGNGVWNLGSFSFQHCREYNCSTPEQADEHQLKRLQGQAQKLQQKTGVLGVEMSLLEELNGIDLANQAPLAALGTPGYADWLKKARDKGLTGSEAVLWARVQSYWDPALNGWNAPGLGNSEDRISHDQNRRLTAITRALDVYEQQVAAGKITPKSEQKIAAKPPEEKTADRIIFQDLH